MELTAILNHAACLAALIAATLPARAAQSAAPCEANTTGPTLSVAATGARSAAGEVAFTLYGADPARFLKKAGALSVIRVKLTASGAQACFGVAEPGEYAVAIYHDENGNHHFDRNFLGLPVEGYGFSNDAPTYLGPPKFQSALIAVHPGRNRIAIKLRY